jgi:hypothetical protein
MCITVLCFVIGSSLDTLAARSNADISKKNILFEIELALVAEREPWTWWEGSCIKLQGSRRENDSVLSISCGLVVFVHSL